MRIASRLIFAIATIVIGITVPAHAQQIAAPDSISRALVSQMPVYDSLLGASVEDKLNVLPRVDYNDKPKPYIIGKIRVHGAVAVDPQMIIDNLGLAAGDTITVPGDAITIAIRGLLDRRFFANMKAATSYREDTVDIDLYLRERIQVRGWDFIGAKNTEKKDLEEKLRLRQNAELSDYLLTTCMNLIREYYDEKAFRNAKIDYTITPDTLIKTAVLVHFHIDRGDKVRVGEITFAGNENLPAKKLAKAMKKTHKVSINFFRSSKFKEKDFEEDLENIRHYAQSQGYRDAVIVRDSIYAIPDKPKRMGLYIELKEGHKYHYRNITWLGNTLYPTSILAQTLGLKSGDVYDSETMNTRLNGQDPTTMSIANTYKDQGYLAFIAEPVETVVPGDSVDVEIRMLEGSQFRIKNVTFDGNTRTNDHVIRRELQTLPGELYSQSLLMRTYQRLASMGQFDAETLLPNVNPNIQQELVDINYSLTEVPNDQFELSGGWGAGMFIASVGVNFTNISLRNFFNKKAWRPYPAGDNQTIGLQVQTNGSYYRALSVSFLEPWLGGRKPTSLSVSFFTSRETNAYYLGQKATAHFGTIGGTIGIGKRLNWPDPYFTLSVGLTMQSYRLNNWSYFIVTDGTCNTLALNLAISRNSVDDIMQYPTTGSKFDLSVAATPPWSAFDGKDYSKPMTNSERYHWVEYHKWKFNAQWFVPLSANNKLVLMARAQFGYLGHYNKNKLSPFEGFQVGGDGLSGYSIYGVETIGLRGYKENALTPLADYGIYARIFSKYTLEMRYPLVRSKGTLVYALLFGEAGNAFNNLESFKPFSLYRSAGIGLRVFLPYLGMLGIDWGYGFDKTSQSNGKAAGGKFSFSLGQTF